MIKRCFLCYVTERNRFAKGVVKNMGYGKDKASDIGISNLGRSAILLYKKYMMTNFVFVPPVVSYTKEVIVLVTMDEKITIVEHRIML